MSCEDKLRALRTLIVESKRQIASLVNVTEHLAENEARLRAELELYKDDSTKRIAQKLEAMMSESSPPASSAVVARNKELEAIVDEYDRRVTKARNALRDAHVPDQLHRHNAASESLDLDARIRMLAAERDGERAARYDRERDKAILRALDAAGAPIHVDPVERIKMLSESGSVNKFFIDLKRKVDEIDRVLVNAGIDSHDARNERIPLVQRVEQLRDQRDDAKAIANTTPVCPGCGFGDGLEGEASGG